jgi:hypothetical protein
MSTWRISAVAVAALALPYAAGCRLLESGPSDEEVSAAIRKAPPSPPTLGPTYLADIAAVEIQQRGRYNATGRYWPVRVRVRGRVKLKLTNPFQLGVIADAQNGPPPAVDFSEDVRFTKDDYGNWRVSYSYNVSGPKWRLGDREAARLGR